VWLSVTTVGLLLYNSSVDGIAGIDTLRHSAVAVINTLATSFLGSVEHQSVLLSDTRICKQPEM
jgi:hypothetical protein